jgi:hypothetical protein
MPNIDLSQPINSPTGPSTAQAAAIRTNLGAAPIDAATLTGHVQMTSQGAQTLTDNSAMTRGLSDARYAAKILYSSSSIPVSFTNSTADSAIIIIVLPIGTYRFESFQKYDNNNARASIILQTGSINVSGYRAQFDTNPAFASAGTTAISASPAFIPGQGPLGLATGNTGYVRSCVMVVSAEATIQLCGAQNTASATPTIVSAGAYMLATKIS